MENNAVDRIVVAAGSEGLQVSEAAEVPSVSENGGRIDGDGGMTMMAASSGGAGESGLIPKRKRGRPRKQLGEMPRELTPMPELPASLQKRGRGRPRGTGKWQMMAASMGGTAGDTVGSHFTPHILLIQQGENIVEKITSFSQRTSDSMCILSACGTVSYAEIFLPAAASRGSVVKYEGQLSIVSLNGSHTYDESRRKICLLSVQLGFPDGRLCGGAVASSLISAGPTQLTIGTFRQNFRPKPIIRPHYPDTIVTVAATPIQSENGEVGRNEPNGLNLIQSPSSAL